MHVMGLAGYSGAGNTTLVERLIPLLRERRLRVSVVKHARHGFEMETPGKDNCRHRQAGALEGVVALPLPVLDRNNPPAVLGWLLSPSGRRVYNPELYL